jgi:hypothetical protein
MQTSQGEICMYLYLIFCRPKNCINVLNTVVTFTATRFEIKPNGQFTYNVTSLSVRVTDVTAEET